MQASNMFNDTNILEWAVVNKIYFESNNKRLTAYDLMDLSVESLDQLAVGLQSQMKKEYVTFLNRPKVDKKQRTLEISLQVIVYIINLKEKEAEAKRNKQQANADLAEVKELINEKKTEERKNLSMEELLKLAEEKENILKGIK